MHYARQGIITPEMEFIAIRENMGRAEETGQVYCPSEHESGLLQQAQTERCGMPIISIQVSRLGCYTTVYYT